MFSGGASIQRRGPVVIVSGLFLLSATACAPDARHPQDPQRVSAPERHAVHSAKLREVMTDLNAIAYDRLPQELNTERETERHLDEIARLAGSIAESATHIPEAVHELGIGEEDRAVFDGMARSLAAEAVELRQLAETKRKDQIAAQWDQVIQRCDACHVQFRLTPIRVSSDATR